MPLNFKLAEVVRGLHDAALEGVRVQNQRIILEGAGNWQCRQFEYWILSQ